MFRRGFWCSTLPLTDVSCNDGSCCALSNRQERHESRLKGVVDVRFPRPDCVAGAVVLIKKVVPAAVHGVDEMRLSVVGPFFELGCIPRFTRKVRPGRCCR